MRNAILAALLLLAPGAKAAIGGGTGFGSDPTFLIEHGTFTLSGNWNFTGTVNISSAVASSTVSAQAPILGVGSSGDPLRLDSSSVTLKGQNVVEKTGDTMTGNLTLPAAIIGGLTDIGARTSAQLRALACAILPCRAVSSTDFDVYTATGTATGQWRNSRLGTGP